MLYKTAATPAHVCQPLASQASRSRTSRASRRRNLATTSYRPQAAPIQRYGKAFEPAAHLRADTEEGKETTLQIAPSEQRAEEIEEEEEEPTTTATATAAPSTPPKSSTTDEASPPTPPEPPKTADPKTLDSVLYMPSPADMERHKPPHLKTPPYVHHFDTYGLVKQLTLSKYSEAQSVTMMKAVRGVLIENMMLARAGLVSKSSVENETYLFSAACAELRTEVENSRKAEIERMRTERDQLQHEVDILGQRLGQETGTIKDELKGLFDDRKMAVRQEQRSMETKVSEMICSESARVQAMANPASADPRTQLPNHHPAQLGRTQ